MLLSTPFWTCYVNIYLFILRHTEIVGNVQMGQERLGAWSRQTSVESVWTDYMHICTDLGIHIGQTVPQQ